MAKLDDLIGEISLHAEWLSTTEGDEVECISIENLEGVLSNYFNKPIKINTDGEL